MIDHLTDTNVGNIEYISKQDVLNLPQSIERNLRGEIVERSIDVKAIESLSSADVAPVVRCKECMHYYFADNRIPQEQRYVCKISGEIWKPDSFCSYGEREG